LSDLSELRIFMGLALQLSLWARGPEKQGVRL
jgi:hypothetical protein